MSGSLWMRSCVATFLIAAVCLVGCERKTSSPRPDVRQGAADAGPPRGATSDSSGVAEAPHASANTADVDAAKKMAEQLGVNAKYAMRTGNVMTAVEITDGSTLTPEYITLLGKLTDLRTLKISNYRALNDEMVSQLTGLNQLTTLALANSVIGDASVELIAKSFPNLTELDLSSNTNLTNGVLKVICELKKLERLHLMQNRFNDLGTSHLSKLEHLTVLDLRGNMEAGNMTLEVVGKLPKLAAFKHRSTAITDFGMDYLAESKALNSLLMQDFAVTNQAGQAIAKLPSLKQLEIFRCQGFGTDGVLALKGMSLSRLKLRDLPTMDDRAMEVLADLPELKRLELHELSSVGDSGLASLASLKSLEALDIWSIPQMSDATVDVIAALPNLKELSIRSTGVTDAAIDKLLAMTALKSLTFSENGSVTEDGLKKLKTGKWSKLNTGSSDAGE